MSSRQEVQTQECIRRWFFLQGHKHEAEMYTETGNDPNQKGGQIDWRRDMNILNLLKGNRKQPLIEQY